MDRATSTLWRENVRLLLLMPRYYSCILVNVLDDGPGPRSEAGNMRALHMISFRSNSVRNPIIRSSSKIALMFENNWDIAVSTSTN